MARLALHWQILIAMLVGAAVGIALNAWAGHRQPDTPLQIPGGRVQYRGMSAAVQLPPANVWIADTPDRISIQITDLTPGQPPATRRVVVGGRPGDPSVTWPAAAAGSGQAEVPTRLFPTTKALAKGDPEAFALLQRHGRSTARWIGDLSRLAGDLFLRLLKMVSVPLIITSLLKGVTGLGRADRLGKMFGRTLVYYAGTSLLAICTGLIAVNAIRPGEGVTDASLLASEAPQAPAPGGLSLGAVLFEQLENMIPPNPVSAVASGNFLSIIAFTIAFGIFTIFVGGTTARTITGLADAGFDVMMRMTMAIIRLAPLGVLFLMLAATAGQGIAVFGTLGWYMLTVACALLFHATVTMPLVLIFIAGRNPLEFLRAMSPALLTAFSSASSNGTLPLTMTCAEERAGVSNRVTSFVLPLGATVNMDGTALYEAVAVLFIAQLTPGIELSFVNQLVVAFTALLASVGAAGIPHAGLVMMVIILQAVGLPTEAQGLIIAVDRVLDMCRTTVNVWGDACGCAVVARLEVQGGD